MDGHSLFRPTATGLAGSSTMTATSSAGRSGATVPLPRGQISARVDLGHLMYDPRIKRGSTQHKESKAVETQAEPPHATVKMGGSLRRPDPTVQLSNTLNIDRSMMRLHESHKFDANSRMRGAQAHHIRAGVRPRQEIDLTAFLEEATAPKATAVTACQTDALSHVDLPDYTVPAKRGVDAGTQIEHGTAAWHAPGAAGPGTGTLFVFDSESDPLVEHLMAGVLGQAVTETGHEDVLIDLSDRREKMSTLLEMDAARERAEEAKAKERAAARSGAVHAAQTSYAQQTSAMEKFAARTAAGAATADAVASAMAGTRGRGGFIDPYQQAVEQGVLPGVLQGVAGRLAARSSAQASMLDAGGLLDGALGRAAEQFTARLAAEEAAAKEANKEYGIRVTVRLLRRGEDLTGPAGALPCDAVAPGDVPVSVEEASEGESSYHVLGVGPVPVKKADSVGDVERRIWAWVGTTKSRHCRRLAAMAGNRPLVLCLGGARLPADSRLLDVPMQDLAAQGLMLKPAAAFAPGEEAPANDGWQVDVPEEVFELPAAAAE